MLIHDKKKSRKVKKVNHTVNCDADARSKEQGVVTAPGEVDDSATASKRVLTGGATKTSSGLRHQARKKRTKIDWSRFEKNRDKMIRKQKKDNQLGVATIWSFFSLATIASGLGRAATVCKAAVAANPVLIAAGAVGLVAGLAYMLWGYFS